MPNRLQFETSPYLLQHRDNPVDWYAWGDEAFAVATRDNKPVLISIGYSACHWCHVMAHESFENPDIASQLNDHFVCIKVDREERPDIDAIYMSAVQGMIGQGGWPLNVFTTPDGTPFFGGTYWPPADRGGMPGFPRVLSTLSSTWHAAPEKLLENADQVRAFLQNSTAALPSNPISNVTTDRAIEQLATQFDPVHGGFGNAPKFPQAPVLEFLIRHAVLRSNDTARAMALTTLDRIADGGIHDHLAGGFARYSVDAEWLVPHFEKMLYDNAQLMVLYADAFKITGNERYRTIVRSIAMWAQREMLTKEGGFCAALDADSEGEEGKFYVWTSEEIDRLLTADEADLVRLHYGVTEAGNFEHNTSILHVSRTLEDLSVAQDRDIVSLETALESAKAKLLIARADRERPGRDDKIITSWNALMIRALAVASHIIDDPDLLAMATGTAKFIKRALVTSSGHLRHSWKDNQTRGDGVLEDYAFLADALIELYRATADPDWLNGANRLVDIVISDFEHESGVGFFDTGVHHERLVTRPRELQDNAIPSGNSVMADVLLTIGTYRQDDRLMSASRSMMEGLAEPMAAHPTAFGRTLAATERHLTLTRELVYAGNPHSPANLTLRKIADEQCLPDLVIGYADPDNPQLIPMLADRPLTGTGAAYLCQNHTCLPPVTDPADLLKIIR